MVRVKITSGDPLIFCFRDSSFNWHYIDNNFNSPSVSLYDNDAAKFCLYTNKYFGIYNNDLALVQVNSGNINVQNSIMVLYYYIRDEIFGNYDLFDFRFIPGLQGQSISFYILSDQFNLVSISEIYYNSLYLISRGGRGSQSATSYAAVYDGMYSSLGMYEDNNNWPYITLIPSTVNIANFSLGTGELDNSISTGFLSDVIFTSSILTTKNNLLVTDTIPVEIDTTLFQTEDIITNPETVQEGNNLSSKINILIFLIIIIVIIITIFVLYFINKK